MAKKKQNSNKKLLTTAILVVISSLITLAARYNEDIEAMFFPAQNVVSLAEGSLEVHMIDVGQGDCFLIKAPQANVLIDAGTVSSSADVLDYLDGVGVSELHYVINTHPHADHVGGMYKILPQMEHVGQVIITNLPEDVEPQTRSWEQFLTSVAEVQAEMSVVQGGAQYDLGGGAVLTTLGPVEPIADFNDSSIICRLDFGETDFLFMGDASTHILTDLAKSGVDISADVLQVGHHGSNTSTDDVLLRLVGPDTALISCGVDNDYGHPHREVTALLESYEVSIYRTDLQGNVVLGTDGQTLSTYTEGDLSAVA